MAQVKIFGKKASLARRRERLSEAVHSCLVEVLGIPEDKKFHRFIGLDADDFIYPSERSDDYTIIEIMMMAGREKETKKRLIAMLFERTEDRLGLAPSDLEICLVESPPENWGFRGKTGDEIKLTYQVKV